MVMSWGMNTMQNNESHYACANAVRVLSIAAIEQAQSGHPGVALGFADVLTVLWREHMRYDLTQPNWQNRDRFVLSNGHASALYYAILHCCGFNLSLDDLRMFRQLGSKTPGHPERDCCLGIDVSTGPLGQGLANAVGIAMAEFHMRHQVNQHEHDSSVIDFFTYVAVGDGCLMEGLSHESASLAGRFGLGKLIVCWDDNGISIDGHIDQWSEYSVVDRFKSYGWQVIEQVDGHCPSAINRAINLAKSIDDQPSLICFKTTIGHGTDLSGQSEVHGKPLGRERFLQLKQSLGWPYDDFFVPDAVYDAWQDSYEANLYAAWYEQCESLPDHLQKCLIQRDDCDDISKRWVHFLGDFHSENPDFSDQDLASRHSSQKILQAAVAKFPELIGGSADLSESTGVLLSSLNAWGLDGLPGRFIHFGVREFAMFAIANGLATCFQLRPFVSTFLVFSDYGINAVRMAALMKLPVIFIFSHDSVMVGEDGPTHQPIEHLSHLRAIPELEVWRPADTNETMLSWGQILQRRDGPSCLVLSRQKLRSLSQYRGAHQPSVAAFRYDAFGDKIDGVLIATGAEVSLAIQAHEQLLQRGIRVGVVSMLCVERFKRQTLEEQSLVLPGQGFRLIIEAGSSQCWYQFLSNFGGVGGVMGIDQFAGSGKGIDNYHMCGFTVENICSHASRLYEEVTVHAD